MAPDDELGQESPELWAERHDGVFDQAIADAAGLSRGQRSRRRTSGRYRKLRRGVDAVVGAPPTKRQMVRATALAVPDDVLMSHGTAAWLLGAPNGDEELIHVTGPLPRVIRLPGVKAHRSSILLEEDATTRDGIRCTSPLRTIIDLSGSQSVAQLGALVDHFVRKRQLRLEDLRSRVARLHPAPGRSPKTLQRELADRIPGYDPGESELEARIARIIARAGLEPPRQQHRVEYGGARFRIDFAWPDRMLYLEGNGFGFHQLTSDLDRDADRQNRLVLAGWLPIEVTWRMSDEVIERTLRSFLDLVASRQLPPATD